MVDPKFVKHENFVITDKYVDEEIQDFSQADYGEDPSGILGHKNLTPFIIGGIAMVAIVILLVTFLSGPDEEANDVQLRSLEVKMQQLEKRLPADGSVDQALERINRLEQKLSVVSENFERSNSVLAAQIDQLTKELSALHIESVQPSQPVATDRASAKPRTHQVRPKETLWGISRQHGLTVEQLLKYNNLGANATLQPGQILKLSPN